LRIRTDEDSLDKAIISTEFARVTGKSLQEDAGLQKLTEKLHSDVSTLQESTGDPIESVDLQQFHSMSNSVAILLIFCFAIALCAFICYRWKCSA